MPILKLRQDTVRTLAHAGGHSKLQCIYWDEALRNFGVRVYASGRRTYVCSYRLRRRKRLAVLGRVDVLTLDQARKKAVAYLGKVASNEDPQHEADTTRELRTIRELCAAYIEGHAKKKKKTWKDDESILDRHVIPKLGLRLATSVVSGDLEPIHASVGVDHPYAANRILGTYRKMVNWAKVAGALPLDYRSPIMGIVRFPERARKRYITAAEMPRFLRALEQEENDYARHAIWLLLLTGLRCKELLRAKWDDIDYAMGTLFIGLTKNGEPLLAPLSDAALARLSMVPRIEGNPYIICGKKAGTCLSGLSAPLERILTRAGLDNIRVHDIRRTVGSWLAHDGRSLHLIGDVLNHRDPKTTAGYAYFQTQQRRDALGSHGDKVMALGAPFLRPGPETKPIVAEMLMPALATFALPDGAAAGEMRHRHYFKREALFELVWTAPVSEVAARLGVSDVALAKRCRLENIPVPPRGYWQRLDAGRMVDRPALPAAPFGRPPLLRIRGTKGVTPLVDVNELRAAA